MSLYDAVARELPFLRSQAESLMTDYGRAMRPTGGRRYDKATQGEVDDYENLFESNCKSQTRTLQARDAEVGGRTSTSVRTELHLPAGTDPLMAGDVWEFTGAGPLSLVRVGQRVRVLAPVSGTYKTAARYEVEEVIS